MRSFSPSASQLRWLCCLSVIMMLVTASVRAQEALPRILILATGGTIAGVANANSPTGYDAGKVSANALVDAVPSIRQLADVKVEQFCNIASQDMTDAIWIGLAKRINKAFDEEKYVGVVVTHGTDTMEETAFFLEHTVVSNRPVVLTGSVRPSTAVSADGSHNLLDAVRVAASPLSRRRGVLLTMNGLVFESRNLTKSSTTSLQAFASTMSGPVGRVDDAGVYYYAAPNLHESHDFHLQATQELPKVGIVYAHANMKADYVKAMLATGVKGIVLAGVGDGNASAEALQALKEAVDQGVIVVRASRVFQGFVHRNHEVNDDNNGFFVSYDLSPVQARILLQLILQDSEYDTIRQKTKFMQRLFESYI